MIKIKRLRKNDFKLIINLQERVYRHPNNKTISQRTTNDFISYCLGERGLCYAAFNEKKAIAYIMYHFPKNKLDKEVEWPYVAHCHHIAIDPDWYNQNLSFMINQIALKELKNRGVKCIFSAPLLYDFHTLNAFLKVGYRVIGLKEEFKEQYRLICHQEFSRKNSIQNNKQITKEVSLHETEMLKTTSSKGYTGIKIKTSKQGASPRLVFLKTNYFKPLKFLGEQIVNDMFDYLADIDLRKVWQPVPSEIRKQLQAPTPKSNAATDNMYYEFIKSILPDPSSNARSYSWGWMNASGIPIIMLADFLTSIINTTVDKDQKAAMMIEEQIIEWIISTLNWPKDNFDVLKTQSSMSQIISHTVTCHNKEEFKIRKFALKTTPRLTIYCSSRTYQSIVKAVKLLKYEGDSFKALLHHSLADRLLVLVEFTRE